MQKLRYSIFLLFATLLLNTSCEKSDPKTDNSDNYANSWIYKQMTVYYYWNDKLPQKPNYTLNTESFFNSLIYSYDKNSNPDGDRFSTIRENYVDLKNSLGGITSDEIGFEYVRLIVSERDDPITQYYLLVLYTKPNTDAEKKGIKRGQFIIQIDGQNITENNFNTLLSGSGMKKLTVAEWQYNDLDKEYQLKQIPEAVSVQMHEEYSEHPIYLHTTLTTDNQTKVGYLVYNFFANDKGDGSYTFDKDLMNALEEINSQGANEFILDLRYNGGGDVSSAIALASALVKDRSNDKLLIYTEFNPSLQSHYNKQYGEGHNKDYFIDKITHNNQLVANIPKLNLSRLHVLVSQFTASASELIINGLTPYMDVVIIGDTTVGKNVGSYVLYEENNPKNKWGIMPITFKYYNSKGESDFITGFAPKPEFQFSEFDDFRLADFGSTDDKLLQAALRNIDGKTAFESPLRGRKQTENDIKFKVVKNSASMRINNMHDSRFNNSIKQVE